jgi:hypothetical protein
MPIKKALWMRSVNFEIVKDLLHFVKANNGIFFPTQLDNAGISERIFIKKDGKAYSRSSMFFYRKIMENLKLILLQRKKYVIDENPNTLKLIQFTARSEPLSVPAKKILAEIIIENPDCRTYFFDLFMRSTKYNFEEFKKFGEPITLETISMRNEKPHKFENTSKFNSIILKNRYGKQIDLDSKNLSDAIYDGVRRWSINLDIVNEILPRFKDSRIIYPIISEYDEKILDKILFEDFIDKNESWSVISIPKFIQYVAIAKRYPLNEIKNYIFNLKRRFSSKVMFIHSSTAFIDIKTPYEKQDQMIRNLYLYVEGEGFISHFRIQSDKKISDYL